MKGRPGHGNQSLMNLIFKYRIIHECVHQSGIYTQVVEVSEIERVTQLVMIMRDQGAGCRVRFINVVPYLIKRVRL